MFTLEEIKCEYELLHGEDLEMDLSEYVRTYFQHVYDRRFNFIGWERKQGA